MSVTTGVVPACPPQGRPLVFHPGPVPPDPTRRRALLRAMAAGAAGVGGLAGTGGATKQLTGLTDVEHLAAGVTEQGILVVTADGNLEHEEADMTASWVRFDDLVDGVLAGRLTDGPLQVAVLALLAMRSRAEG